MIEFDCPHCNHHITAADSAAGKGKTCPKCNAQLTVPSAAPVVVNAASEVAATSNESTNPTPSVTDATSVGIGTAPAVLPSQGGAEETRIPCPVCGELIAAQAKKCRFCGEVLGAAALAGGQHSSIGIGPTHGAGNPELDRIKNFIREFWTTKFCAFAGRATRREYWYIQLHIVVLALCIYLFSHFAGSLGAIVMYTIGNALIIPNAALLFRRCQDANLSGIIGIALSVLTAVGADFSGEEHLIRTDKIAALFAIILGLIVIVGPIVIGLLPGIKGANQYGPDPYEPTNDNAQPNPMAA